jgi:hypothetical protein
MVAASELRACSYYDGDLASRRQRASLACAGLFHVSLINQAMLIFCDLVFLINGITLFFYRWIARPSDEVMSKKLNPKSLMHGQASLVPYVLGTLAL